MRIDRRLLGWGSFLIIAGAIPLAVRAGALPRDVLEGWPSVWPLFLVGAGIGLVFAGTPIRPLGGLISVVTAGIMLGGLLTVGFDGVPAFGTCGSGTSAPAFATASGTVSSPASVEIDLSCGTLDVSAADGTTWSVAGRSPGGRTPTIDASADRVRVASIRHANVTFDTAASTWQVQIPRSSALDLSVTLNAGSSTVDLGGATIHRLNLTLNAGSLRTDLSSAVSVDTVRSTVNAGSAELLLPSGTTSAGLTINAGSLTVCVPANTQLAISWTGALAGNNFGSIGLVKVDDNHWTTSGVGASPTTLDVSANAGSFSLFFGDACNA